MSPENDNEGAEASININLEKTEPFVLDEDDESGALEEIRFEPGIVVKGMKSLCWEFMHFKGTKRGGPDTKRVFCNLCPDKVLGKKHPGLCYKTSTSNITDHLKRHHALVYNKAEKEKFKGKTYLHRNYGARNELFAP